MYINYSLIEFLFLSSYRNTSESLGIQEILWKREPIGECFPKLS